MSNQPERMENPSASGTYNIQKTFYSSESSKYENSGYWVEYYNTFSKDPTRFPSIESDFSGFVMQVAHNQLPFQSTQVPLEGVISYPLPNEPGEKFPLVLFVHGAHSDWKKVSAKGYDYLLDMLASQGIVAASINLFPLMTLSTFQSDPFGKLMPSHTFGAKALCVLEHLKLFRLWNEGEVYCPLSGMIDMDRIMLVGHSRGGEAVAHASYINNQPYIKGNDFHPLVPLEGKTWGLGNYNAHSQLGPYGFNIRAVTCIAPTFGTDFWQYHSSFPVLDNCFFIHGTRDGDTPSYLSNELYALSHPLTASSAKTSGSKGFWRVHGANHNYFNSEWAYLDNRAEPVPTPWACDALEKAASITPQEQQAIAKVFIGTLARSFLQDQESYLAVLRDHTLAVESGWLPEGTQLATQFQDRERLVLQHHQEDLRDPRISAPLKGRVEVQGNVQAWREPVDFGRGLRHWPIMQLKLQWTGSGSYTLHLEAIPWAGKTYEVLALTVGQACELNPFGQAQDFRIEVASAANTASFLASDFHRLLYPDASSADDPQLYRALTLQTLRIPLAAISAQGVDVEHIDRIALQFDQTATGSIYCSGVQFSR